MKCPNCGNLNTHRRSGPHFEHEWRCPKCETCFEPTEPQQQADVDVEALVSTLLSQVPRYLSDDAIYERTKAEFKATIQQALAAKETKWKCEHCGSDRIYSGPPDCPSCGAPNCCQTCCKITTLEAELDALRKDKAIVDDIELRQCEVKWGTFNNTKGESIQYCAVNRYMCAPTFREAMAKDMKENP